jgi:hypothetical protein
MSFRKSFYTVFCIVSVGIVPTVALADDVVFSRDIQPLLAKHCLVCHGTDKAESGLRLDVEESAIQKLESGQRAIVPGKALASEILKRVTSTDESERMPPEGDPLTPTQIELLTRWINDGAKYETHWAYRPVSEPTLPVVRQQDRVRGPIDQFVLARLEAAGLAPSKEADRPTLIKRLYYDLLGLPPTPQEVDAFVADQSPDAYKNLVDRLLASEHFGERWGRHWLDKARYADSDGYEKDRPRPNAWRYRDWVIDAINRDMPFDQFTIEQLAGDLLPDPTVQQKLATAFHRQTLTNTEGGTDQEQFRVEATFDRTETTAAIWLGLTMTCARCHSHKYDQIPQREYYQLFSFFNNVNETNIDVPRSEVEMQKYLALKADHDAQVSQLQERYDAAKATLTPQIQAWEKDMAARLAANDAPVSFASAKVIEAKSDSGAKLEVQDDGSFLVTGAVPDKDRFTLTIEAPTLALTGLQLEVLTDNSLPGNGPGRAPNGNFVLSEVRVSTSPTQDFKQATPVVLSSAEADFAQDKFAPAGAISTEPRSGWAVSPQMGKNHAITLFATDPSETPDHGFVQVVLDQQYGGKHTIGRFRVTTMSGFDPLRALPEALAKAIRTAPEKRSAAQQLMIADHVASQDPAAGKLARELDAVKKKAPQSPLMSVRILAAASRETRLLHRGDFLQPADPVPAGALGVLSETHPLSAREAEKGPDRLDLAQWLVDGNHPLTARVTVNQIWGQLFGRGLVPTLNDFGVRGEQPENPQLLDWLAWQFPRSMGWSRKTLIKEIVSSATYRQSSQHRPELQKVDPTNRLLARQNRIRVEAEIVRDLYLASSGLLSKKLGGPSVFPPLPPGVAELSYANNFKWATSSGEDRYRRGMYTFFKRTSPHPTLTSFDCPDSNTSQLSREISNTPLQALATLNNEVFTEAAQAMARRVLQDGGSTDVDRLSYALRLCIARRPEAIEIEKFHELLDAARDYYQSHEEAAKQMTQRHTVVDVPAPENAAWVATLRMVLNLDEFIVRD